MKQIGNTWVDRVTEEIRTPQPPECMAFRRAACCSITFMATGLVSIFGWVIVTAFIELAKTL